MGESPVTSMKGCGNVMTGVPQRREDRIKGALSMIGLWHNLFHPAPC
jgi:transposase